MAGQCLDHLGNYASTLYINPLALLIIYVYTFSHVCQLIIVTGLPTSGKTHRAQQIQTYFQKRISSTQSNDGANAVPLRVHLISDHSLGISRDVYNLEDKDAHERSNNASEKDTRANIYGAVKRVLTDHDVVILDGANYIKGWRYQLYCEAKAVRTTSCVVHIGTSVETARAVNEQRLVAAGAQDLSVSETDLPYQRDCWDNLVFRYEEPNAMTRWDSPLFTVLWDDAEPPYEALWEALIGSSSDNGKKVVKPHQATVLKDGSSEGYLYELDRNTQEILNKILEWTRDHPGEGGGTVILGEDLAVDLPANSIGLPALQRIRRQFITLNRTSKVPSARLREGFVGYLNDHFSSLD